MTVTVGRTLECRPRDVAMVPDAAAVRRSLQCVDDHFAGPSFVVATGQVRAAEPDLELPSGTAEAVDVELRLTPP